MNNLNTDAETAGTTQHPSERNRVEQAVVEHLIDRVRQRLTDRSGERHPPPWEPKQEVRIGVLRPVINYDAVPEDTEAESDATPDDPSDAPADEVAPLENLQVLGLDFVVAPGDAAETVALSVDVELAVYLPDNPTEEEALRHFSQQQQDEAAIAEAAEEGDAVAEDAAETTDPVGEGQNVPLQVVWRRVTVSQPGITLEVPPTGEHITDAGTLTSAIEPVVSEHFARPEAARPFKAARVVPVSELRSGSYEGAIAQRSDTTWSPAGDEGFEAELTAFAERLPDGTVLVSVSLTNSKNYAGKPFLDLTLYDCRFSVTVEDGAALEPQRFTLAPEDYRYEHLSEVPGHGRGCVAVSDAGNIIRTETLPIHAQSHVKPRSSHVPEPRWEVLARDPVSVLSGVRDAMRRERNAWESWLVDPSEETRQASQIELDHFVQEVGRFELGMEALELDGRLLRAFELANEAFENLYVSNAAVNSWRLFQLVYIVSHLPALAAREHRNVKKFVDELDSVDVLWFPTGGGKTEAYLGLIVTAALYDRMRGKERGVTAWLKFPLRMLSVQQLVRVLRILVAAEKLRVREGLGGAPFELGYLVGGGNTPNSLRWQQGWWPGFDSAAKASAGQYDGRRLIGQCPFCGEKGRIGLDVDPDEYRVKHVCRSCEATLPVHMTDEEIYRYQPTVIVSTVDKVTGFAHYGEFTSFTHGPRLSCPDHGYLSFGRCSAGDRCKHDRRSYQSVSGWKDPVPALMIQDEMHLIREELGAFDAHFEGLLAELQTAGPSGLPSKILAATATIEQFEDQLRQVYGRTPRRFPAPGFTLDRSFYSETTPDTRRIFLGVMPTGGGVSKVEVAGAIQRELLRTIHELQNDPTAAQKLAADSGSTTSPGQVEELLFLYELSLGFVNSKAHGAMIRDEFGAMNFELQHAGEDQVSVRVLTSEVPVPELAEVIDLVEDADRSVPRAERLRAIVGTSVVSHGVDLERLNCMVMAGLPSTTADYIQATSRSGRTHVGLIVTVFDHFSKRESSTFTNFLSTHRFLDRLVEPVPVNKFAKNAVDRTLPALVVALLWDLARDPKFKAPPAGIRATRDFKGWWNAEAANGLDVELLDRLKRSYRSPVAGVNPQSFEDRLAEAAERRWTAVERVRMLQFDADKLAELFAERVLTSLRDIDEAVRFGAMPHSRQLYEAMFDQT